MPSNNLLGYSILKNMENLRKKNFNFEKDKIKVYSVELPSKKVQYDLMVCYN